MIGKAILKINPNAIFAVREEEIEWLNGTKPIPKEQILAMIAQLEKENNIIKNRINEYGSWQDQLDEIYHQGLDSWKQRISSIKAKYPKN